MRNYARVIPRDLFNEANLLKCFGRLYLCLEREGKEQLLQHDDERSGFIIGQNQDTGSTYLANVWLELGNDDYNLSRPLNSRKEWPLYLETAEDAIPVFDDKGELTPEFLAVIRKA